MLPHTSVMRKGAIALAPWPLARICSPLFKTVSKNTQRKYDENSTFKYNEPKRYA